MSSLTEKIARAVARGQTADTPPDRAQIIAHCDSVGVDVLDASALALKCRSCSRVWYPVPILNRLEPNYCRCPGSKCNRLAVARARRQSSRQTAVEGTLLSLRKAVARAELAGISRTSIADAAGVNRGQLSRLMAGGHVPRLDTADAIARAIGHRLALVKVG
jgi:DNA-binding phage protein